MDRLGPAFPPAHQSRAQSGGGGPWPCWDSSRGGGTLPTETCPLPVGNPPLAAGPRPAATTLDRVEPRGQEPPGGAAFPDPGPGLFSARWGGATGTRPLVYTWSHPGASPCSSSHRLGAHWHLGAALKVVVPGSGWWTHPRSLEGQLPVVAGDTSLLGPAPWVAPELASPRLGRKSILRGLLTGRRPLWEAGPSPCCPPPPTHTTASASSLLTSGLTAITQVLHLQALPHRGPGHWGDVHVALVCLRAASGFLWGPTLPRPQPSAHCSPRTGHLEPVKRPQTLEPPLGPR